MLLLIGIAIILILILMHRYHNYTTVSAESDGVMRKWNVLADYNNSTAAAQSLAQLHTRMMTFLRAMRAKYSLDATDEELNTHTDMPIGAIETAKSRPQATILLKNLIHNYNPEVIVENNARINGGTSWTINKGDSMHMCLRKMPNANVLEDADISFFVLLHECAHIANRASWGHEVDFWTVFKFILKEAASCGVYKPIDYSKSPMDFCGLYVNYNPYYDNSLADI